MKIALVAWSLDASQNGVNRCVLELARRLGREHEVDVIAHTFAGEPPPGVRFVRVPIVRGVRDLVFFVVSALALWRRSYDLVHLHVPSLARGDVASAHILPRSAWAAYRALPPEQRPPFSPLLMIPWRLNDGLYAYTYRRARRVVAVSEPVRSDLEELYGVEPGRIDVVPHGTQSPDRDDRQRESLRRAARRAHGVDDATFVFLFLSHVLLWKGLGTVLPALARMRDRSARLLVVGEQRGVGTRAEELAASHGVASRVIVRGPLEDVSGAYLAADCLVFPSIYESFGLVLLEAMAHGLPAVASRSVGAAPALLEGSGAGILLDSCGDVGKLAEAMDRMAADPAASRVMGERARETASRWTWERNVEGLWRTYQTVAGTSGSQPQPAPAGAGGAGLGSSGGGR